MTQMMPSNLRALPVALTLIAGASWSPAASAQSTPAPPPPASSAQPEVPAEPGGYTMRLTDEQRDAILDANTEERAAAARGELNDLDEPDRRIHGEMGVMIGTNGTRGIYGTADIPLGENGGATISFENSRYGYPRARQTRRD